MNKLTTLSSLALALLIASGTIQADTLKKIKDSGAVTMGVRESSGALSYTLGGDGKYAGFHVEICQRVLADLQKQLGLAKLDIQYQPVTAQNRIPLVQNGTVDIECGSTTNNAARQKDVAFAVTTYVEEVRIAVKADSGINSIAQLDGRTWLPPPEPPVCNCYASTKMDGVNFKEVFGKDHADSFLLLESGRADAFVMDGQILGNIAKSKNPAGFKIVGEVLAVEPIAIMLRKDDAPFKQAVDASIKGLMKSATSPSCMTAGSWSPSRPPRSRWAYRRPRPPGKPGQIPTTSRWRSTPSRSPPCTGGPRPRCPGENKD